MSLEYTLEIIDSQHPALLKIQLGGLPCYGLDDDKLWAYGMQIHIDKPGPLESNTIIEEFGFRPSVSVTFRVNKNADIEEMRKCLILGCMELLSNNSEDAVLLFNGETVIMWRRETMLLLNK